MSGSISSISGAGVKSIQQGYIVISGGGPTSNTATITAVNTAKSICFFGGATTPEGVGGGARVTLTDATTVTATKLGTNYGAHVGYTVVEFY